MPTRRYRLIANPISGTKDRRVLLEGLLAGLREAGHEADIAWTSGPGDATTLAAAAEVDVDVVVACGGDGTLREVADGLRGGGAALGVIPSGTANVLAHEFKLPWKPEPQLQMLLGERRHTIDAGICNGERFLLMIGAGLDGAVAHAHTRKDSGRNSYLRYVRPVWETVRDMPLHPMRIAVDGKAMPDGITSVVVANCRGFGNVFEAVSAAEPDDGLFDVIGLTGKSRLQWTAYLAAALARKLHEMPGAHTARGTHIWIESDTPVPMQRDGDPYGFTPAEITMEPGAVTLVVP